MPYENLSASISIGEIIVANKKLANLAYLSEKKHYEEVAVLIKEIEKVKASWKRENGELSRQYGEQIARLASRILHLEKIIDRKSRDNRILKINIGKSVDNHAAEIAHLILQLENSNSKQEEVVALKKKNIELIEELQAAQHEANALKERVGDLLSSNSWRITFPMRLVSTGIKRIFAAFRANC